MPLLFPGQTETGMSGGREIPGLRPSGSSGSDHPPFGAMRPLPTCPGKIDRRVHGRDGTEMGRWPSRSGWPSPAARSAPASSPLLPIRARKTLKKLRAASP